ncbi:methyl-accepting chemotaxis protein [Bradyrhizobium japonicum]|uniref:methyl-accepting chemotaxis protein n=1 Tax=Bradyrhizobium japonicum TaxID=375 RepID=UPI0004569B84|nr:HAMP domain-containing methyl-accepting chemotaxis protein [Bradyrhizobium japonicum]AHY49191.1 methyl accepting chemotaxis protein [Bradyrhizobium japonicum SEMIA 5079]MCD9110714.1 methyl-accepting chemotaxis protein [Bradyrhizobium japonicum]MCD9256990.1 methyl-accepting chemotaxis protein [Bradyrhizobium japonicum SEMIA 5079]MCD9822248.1 methyl-accepting chemotaxis protein [Bradyrhizobium japonicum]MCD9894268.1 methyl-accepting chemotaxis protein [Bradyrhizobium japonicum]
MSGFSIRLTHKVMAIGLFGLVGLVVFGAIYEIGSLSQDASRTVANRARAIADLNNQLTIEMLEARRNEKNFQQRRNESYAKAHAELMGPINRDFDEVGRLMAAGGMSALSDKTRQAHDGFKRYAEHFKALVVAETRIGLNETLGLSGSLRAAVHDIEVRLKEIDDPRTTSWMLMMRRHEKDFMLRREPKYIAEVKKAAVEFSKAIEVVAVPTAVMNDITAKLQKYQSEFAAWAETAQQSAALDASMMKTFRELEPSMVEVRTAVDAMYEQANAAEVATRDAVRLWMMIAFAVTVVVLAVVGFFLGRSISKALSGMVGAMTRLARGELSIAVPGAGRNDEIGEMAGAVEVFRTNMAEAERLRAEQAEADARGRERRKADMHRLADGFEGAVGEIIDTVSSAATELEASSNALTQAAERGNGLATAVAAASEEASANVQSVSSASEEMTTSISEISRQVQESARVADVAVEQAQRTNARVAELTKAAGRIGDVVELINTIAGQTNLLALNATIEAARAGEAGKGFAVVATEVKALAEQTAKATGEIGQHIGAIQTATQDSVGAIKEIGDTIARMSEISSAIAAAVEEQGAATQEISRNIQHAAHGTSEVSANIGNVQRGAGETGAASAQVHSAAQSLSQESNRLKSEVARFLESVRAA